MKSTENYSIQVYSLLGGGGGGGGGEGVDEYIRVQSNDDHVCMDQPGYMKGSQTTR